MRRTFVAAVALVVGLVAPAAVMAQDADALRKELEQLRRQFDQMRQQYEKAIDALSDRLEKVETQAAPSAPAAASTPRAVSAPPATPVTAQAPPGVGPPGPAPTTPPSVTDVLRPREPFSLAARRGSGQLLFDVGLAGDFVGNLTQDNVDKANAGTFAGRENRFFPREIELLVFGQIDPFARGEVRIEAAEEFEDGARATEVHLAEANLTLIALPFGTQLKLGLMRNRFGLLNQLHREALPQTDQPQVLTRFFGEEGLVEPGAELTWVAPLPFYLEALAGIFTGDNEDAFGHGSLKSPLLTGRLRTFFELGGLGGLQVGASAASGESDARRHQRFFGGDVKWKLQPEGWRHALLTAAAEGIWSRRRIEVLEDVDGDSEPEGYKRNRERFGWYTYAEVQPWLRWSGGVRYDSTQFLEAPGREWAIEPYVTFKPSDFLRFRLGWKHTERDRRLFVDNDSSARSENELLFQATFILGAHAAHPF